MCVVLELTQTTRALCAPTRVNDATASAIGIADSAMREVGRRRYARFVLPAQGPARRPSASHVVFYAIVGWMLLT